MNRRDGVLPFLALFLLFEHPPLRPVRRPDVRVDRVGVLALGDALRRLAHRLELRHEQRDVPLRAARRLRDALHARTGVVRVLDVVQHELRVRALLVGHRADDRLVQRELLERVADLLVGERPGHARHLAVKLLERPADFEEVVERHVARPRALVEVRDRARLGARGRAARGDVGVGARPRPLVGLARQRLGGLLEAAEELLEHRAAQRAGLVLL
mmetsp:Transcript_34597/g.106966  ORF Transcript_34597/g.106966 Transcript_34597/m.106966 type:complete len:215 (-) Transcript_34597:295-939(-)